MGRFLNADDTNYLGASGTVLGFNLFAYCENNPITGYDPFGYLDGSAVAKWLNASSIFAMFIDGLYYSFTFTLLKISAYITSIVLPKVIAFVWWHPWVATGIVLVAVGITIASVLAIKRATINNVKKKIPAKLLTRDGRVDLNRFSTRMPGGGRKGPDGWQIVKDTAKHAGSVWKLLDWAGRRVATLWGDGSIRGK